MSDSKVYVDVTASFTTDGEMIPTSLVWEDGSTYEIDKVLDVRQAPSLKAGGQGDRYTVKIKNKKKYLFFERSPDIGDNSLGRWFLERKE